MAARLGERIQFLARSRFVAGFDERFGQMQPDGSLVRRELRCLLELFDSLGDLALLDQQRPQRVHHRGIRRCECRGFFRIRHCFGIAQLARNPGEIVEEYHVLGLLGDDCLIVASRGFVILFAQRALAEIVVQHDILRMLAQPFIGRSIGCRAFAAAAHGCMQLGGDQAVLGRTLLRRPEG